MYTGTSLLETTEEVIDIIYKEKRLECLVVFPEQQFFQNQYISLVAGQKSAIGKYQSGWIHLVNTKQMEKHPVSGIKPRNREQFMAMDALLDDSISVVSLTGRAGSGKTLLSMAAAIHKIDQGKYNKIVLTRPMSQVGEEKTIGFLPGDVNEKFYPFLSNYLCNFEHLGGQKKNDLQTLVNFYNIEVIPIALIRGASWSNAFILADECQSLTKEEMLTLGTRASENSKLVLLGDLKQIDGFMKNKKTETGLYRFINSDKAMNSPHVASINLHKSERGEIATIFADIFEE